MRGTWTDERLDDLNGRVDDLGRRMDAGFDRVDADLRSLRTEMNTRIDSVQRTMIQVGGGMIATYLVGFAGLIATHA
ncbi:MAG TPA: hypothetical protein VNY83_02085 [Solirubrobacterales bacterium]|nr:hypothetical protein [Solirubrobacterales bacterium]